MQFSTSSFNKSITTSPRRLNIPLMTAPGFKASGISPADAYKDASLQFQCISYLAVNAPADAIVTFMDLSVEAEAFGCPLVFNGCPEVAAPVVSDIEQIEALKIPAVGVARTAQCLECASRCAAAFPCKPVFAGVIGPFSLAGRLADMSEMMMLAASEPDTARALLDKVTQFLTDYILAIRATGVAGVIIAEPAAGLVSPGMCHDFSSAYIARIAARVKRDDFMLILHNCGNTIRQVPALIAADVDALHVGNVVDILDILRQVPSDMPVMGNIDPVSVLTNETPDNVRRLTLELLTRTASYPNYVLSSGCDIPPEAPMENILAYLDACSVFNLNGAAK